MRARLLPWLVAVVVVAIDRVTKLAIIDALPRGGWRPIAPGFALTHVHNRGIAFSLFADGGPLGQALLQIVIVLAVVVIAFIAYRHAHASAASAWGLGLILGGAVGNLIDRLAWGAVVDFLHLWVRRGETVYSWPDFNVADMAITIGAGLLLLHELVVHRRQADGDASEPH